MLKIALPDGWTAEESMIHEMQRGIAEGIMVLDAANCRVALPA